MAEHPLMKYWEAPDGTVYEVCDEEARSKSGGISSDEITAIKVIDRAEYEALPKPRPSTTAYLIRG